MVSSEKATSCQGEGRFHGGEGGDGYQGRMRMSRNGDESSQLVSFQPASLKTSDISLAGQTSMFYMEQNVFHVARCQALLHETFVSYVKCTSY